MDRVGREREFIPKGGDELRISERSSCLASRCLTTALCFLPNEATAKWYARIFSRSISVLAFSRSSSMPARYILMASSGFLLWNSLSPASTRLVARSSTSPFSMDPKDLDLETPSMLRTR